MKSTATFLFLLMTGSSFGQYSRGINLAGAEFGENNLPGMLGRDYTFNSETTYRYFGAKNLNLVRLMLRWERLQPVLRGPLDQSYLAGAKNNITMREQTSRVDLFMMSTPELESTGDYTAGGGLRPEGNCKVISRRRDLWSLEAHALHQHRRSELRLYDWSVTGGATGSLRFSSVSVENSMQ